MLLNSIIDARLENPASSPATFSANFQASGALSSNGYQPAHRAAFPATGEVSHVSSPAEL
jgi:hypothetical protein